MWKAIAIGAALAALLFGSAPAFAFEETPPPPVEKAETPAKSKTPAPMQLGSPAIPGEEEAEPKGGLFGFGLLPKLNFGLELMYGEDQEHAEPKPAETTEEKGEVGLLGRVKRLF